MKSGGSLTREQDWRRNLGGFSSKNYLDWKYSKERKNQTQQPSLVPLLSVCWHVSSPDGWQFISDTIPPSAPPSDGRSWLLLWLVAPTLSCCADTSFIFFCRKIHWSQTGCEKLNAYKRADSLYLFINLCRLAKVNIKKTPQRRKRKRTNMALLICSALINC